MTRWLGGVAFAVVFAACSAPDSQTSSEPPSTPSSPTTIAGGSPATVAPPAPAGHEKSADPLIGSWKLLMGTATWTVHLGPREGFPGEYLGKGQRENGDEAGKAVTMDIGAVREKDIFRAWLGPGVIKCRGSFHPRNDIKGTCTEMNGDSAGKFLAQRLPAALPGAVEVR